MEISSNKEENIKSKKEDIKECKVINAPTSRKLVSLINASNIKKSDILTIINVDSQFLVFYYK